MSLAGTILGALALAATGLGLYVQGGFLLPFTFGLSALRLRRRDGRLRLVGADASAMATTGYGLFAIVPLAFLRGPLWGGLAIVAGALFWTSLRVRIEGDGAHSRLRRYVLWGIPWRWHEAAEPIAAWTDGWGDFMDPEALHARVGEVELELGWSHRGSGRRADEIVAALTHPAPTPG